MIRFDFNDIKMLVDHLFDLFLGRKFEINMKKAKTLLVFLTSFQLLTLLTNVAAQNEDSISDFYLLANKKWIKETELPENYVVINQAGILWEEIEKESVEILQDSLDYGLDEQHLFALQQLRNFYRSTFDTIENPRKRVAEVQKNLPMIFGIVFSRITISEKEDRAIREIIKYLSLAYKQSIQNSSLIGDKHKELFLSKLDNLIIEIGAPSLSEFPKLPELSEDAYAENLALIKLFQIESGKIQTDWRSPYETDCFYYPGSNKINIYAGILIGFDHNECIANLFATVGRTIAHEMTHAFDMVGEKYDMNGGKISWIKKLFSGLMFDYDKRDEKYKSLIRQFDHYSYRDSIFVDGNKTLQENYADLGGVEVSILALKLYLEDRNHNVSENEMDDWLRKYFLSYARFWREIATPEFERSTYKRIHTPQKFRAIGPIYNQDDFYRIFNIDEESEYYIPESERLSIW